MPFYKVQDRFAVKRNVFDGSPSPGLVFDGYHQRRNIERHLKQTFWLKK